MDKKEHSNAYLSFPPCLLTSFFRPLPPPFLSFSSHLYFYVNQQNKNHGHQNLSPPSLSRIDVLQVALGDPAGLVDVERRLGQLHRLPLQVDRLTLQLHCLPSRLQLDSLQLQAGLVGGQVDDAGGDEVELDSVLAEGQVAHSQLRENKKRQVKCCQMKSSPSVGCEN